MIGRHFICNMISLTTLLLECPSPTWSTWKDMGKLWTSALRSLRWQGVVTILLDCFVKLVLGLSEYVPCPPPLLNSKHYSIITLFLIVCFNFCHNFRYISFNMFIKNRVHKEALRTLEVDVKVRVTVLKRNGFYNLKDLMLWDFDQCQVRI